MAEDAVRQAAAGETPAELWQGRVERLGWGGIGFARLEDGRALLLTAPLALFPGEEVETEIRQHSRHAEGRVTRWLTRDPRRGEPNCPVAERCGGCSMWGSWTAYSELKKLQIEDLLLRQFGPGQAFDWYPASSAPSGSAVRRRIQLHWDGARLGFHEPGSHKIVEVSGCPVSAPELDRAIPKLRAALEARQLPRNLARWELACGTPAREVLAYRVPGSATESAGPADSRPQPVWRLTETGKWEEGRRPLYHQLGEHRLLQPPGAFFQVCPPWAWESFSRVLLGMALGGDVLYDVYSGVGFFSRLLAPRFRRYRLIEGSALACSALAQNLAGLDYEVRQQDAGQWDARAAQNGDTILLDPPRAGLPERLSRALAQCRAGHIVLIGCDGAAFCRDVKRLAPGWELRRLAVLDLFPNTSEAEFVGLLRPAAAHPRS